MLNDDDDGDILDNISTALNPEYFLNVQSTVGDTLSLPPPTAPLPPSSQSLQEKADEKIPSPPKKKLHKVSSQDIQKAQLAVLQVEKVKIEMEVENLQLIQEKMRLEIQELQSRVYNDILISLM